MSARFLARIVLILIVAWFPVRSFARQPQTTRIAPKISHGRKSQHKQAPMVFIRGGRFQMGIDRAEIPRLQSLFGMGTPQLFEDEVPRHWVSVSDFRLDQYLVTNAQFQKFVDLNPGWRPGHLNRELDNGNYLKHWKVQDAPLAETDHPVANVNWYAAVAYCQSIGKRLPTEAEWEYAARGGTDRLFPWGDAFPEKNLANYGGSIGGTSTVGQFAANAYGLFDMVGNVWEFLADEWGPYTAAEQKDPVGGGERFLKGHGFLSIRSRRVIRGGSFEGAPVNLWIEYRDSHPPTGSQPFVGFRCAK